MQEKLKQIINTGFRDKKILLTTLCSPFLDSQYVFPYLGILYLLAVARKNGMRIKYFKAEGAGLSKDDFCDHDIFLQNQLL